MSISYQDYCKNCKAAEKVWIVSKRVLNSFIRANKAHEILCQTKVLAVLYCTLAEAYFCKILHTPNTLTEIDIANVQDFANKNGIGKAWLKILEIGQTKVIATRCDRNDKVKNKLSKLIDNYIIDPSVIRNKIAHGQWVVAFNREHTEINNDIALNQLDCVNIEKSKLALESIAQLITDILSSPNKAHMRDYWTIVCNLEEELNRRKNWNQGTKKDDLKRIKR